MKDSRIKKGTTTKRNRETLEQLYFFIDLFGRMPTPQAWVQFSMRCNLKTPSQCHDHSQGLNNKRRKKEENKTTERHIPNHEISTFFSTLSSILPSHQLVLVSNEG